MKVLSRILRGRTRLQMRLGAQLWHHRLRQAPTSGQPLVIFAIPLVSRAQSQDWAVVSSNLAATLQSLAAQTSCHWVALVCGHDRPDGIDFESDFDGRTQFIDYRGRIRAYDKGDKRRALIDAALRAFPDQDGYYAQWDADDLLHPDAVNRVLEHDNRRGYLISRGYIADIHANVFAPLGPSPSEGGQLFFERCGSCSFVHFDFRSQPRHWRRLLARMSSHQRIPEWMRLSGLPLDDIGFPAAIYSVNHGENDRTRRGIDAGHRAELAERALSPAAANKIRAAFKLMQTAHCPVAAENRSQFGELQVAAAE